MKTITVKGVGNVQVKPDLVVVSMNLETIDAEYGAAMERAAGKIEKLDDALGKVGFEKHSVKTTNFDVHTEYDSVKNKDGKYERVFLGYECSHRLKVEFDFDVKRLADVLSVLAACDVAPELSVALRSKIPKPFRRSCCAVQRKTPAKRRKFCVTHPAENLAICCLSTTTGAN